MTVSPAPRLVSNEQSEWFWFLGTRITVKARAADTSGGYGLIEQELPAGFAPPLHIHHGEDEQFYILEGRLTFQCGGRRLELRAGDFLMLPRGVPHTFVVEPPGKARLLQLTSPGGAEDFFTEFGTPVATSEDPPAEPPDFERLEALARKYRIEFVEPE